MNALGTAVFKISVGSGRAFGAALLLLASASEAQSVPPMKVHFIDVGQGDATLFEFPCAAVLVDTGGESNPDFESDEHLFAYLDAFFDRRTDLDRTFALVALSHPHVDHSRGVEELLRKGFGIENILLTQQSGGSGWRGQKALLDRAQILKVPYRSIAYDRLEDVEVLRDEVIDPVDCRQASPSVDVDPKIQVLWGRLEQDPGWGYWVYKGKKKFHHDNANNHSLVLRVDYGNASVLLTGDLEEEAIEDLVHRYSASELDIDVYQVGHHGSANGTTNALLDRMSPKIAVLSMGPSTRKCRWWRGGCWTAYAYGHPRKTVIDDLESSVSLRRAKSVTEQVAREQKTFEAESIEKCIYGTGWTGTVVLSLETSGWIDVEQPADQPCGGSSPSPGFVVADSIEPDESDANALTLDAESGGESSTEPGAILAAKPMCEASAALVAPWDDELVLVADNELYEQLFGFELDEDTLEPEIALSMPDDDRPRDLEALARVGDAVLAVGSHSRNSACEVKSKRMRMRLLSARSDGSLESEAELDDAETWERAMRSPSDCLDTLFVDPPPGLAAVACAAFLEAERAASPSDCRTLNVEGAFGVEERVWLGLRAPLAEGQALALRMTRGFAELRFDRVALLDLAGRGIRELALAGDTLYGIAGPELDVRDPFALFSIALDALSPGGRLTPTLLRTDLPTSSEGMFIDDDRAYVTVDGDEGYPDCTEHSRQYSVRLGD